MSEVQAKDKLKGKSDYIGWLKVMKKRLRKKGFLQDGKWVTDENQLIEAHDLITDFLDHQILNRTPNNENDPEGLMKYLASAYGAGLADDEIKISAQTRPILVGGNPRREKIFKVSPPSIPINPNND
jgi:hypothetical protein